MIRLIRLKSELNDLQNTSDYFVVLYLNVIAIECEK